MPQHPPVKYTPTIEYRPDDRTTGSDRTSRTSTTADKRGEDQNKDALAPPPHAQLSPHSGHFLSANPLIEYRHLGHSPAPNLPAPLFAFHTPGDRFHRSEYTSPASSVAPPPDCARIPATRSSRRPPRRPADPPQPATVPPGCPASQSMNIARAATSFELLSSDGRPISSSEIQRVRSHVRVIAHTPARRTRPTPRRRAPPSRAARSAASAPSHQNSPPRIVKDQPPVLLDDVNLDERQPSDTRYDRNGSPIHSPMTDPPSTPFGSDHTLNPSKRDQHHRRHGPPQPPQHSRPHPPHLTSLFARDITIVQPVSGL